MNPPRDRLPQPNAPLRPILEPLIVLVLVLVLENPARYRYRRRAPATSPRDNFSQGQAPRVPRFERPLEPVPIDDLPNAPLNLSPWEPVPLEPVPMSLSP